MTSGTEPYNWYASAPVITADEIQAFGTTLVIAPHQDDESLGCGGTIALLRQAGIPVKVVFTTDGGLSHPNSKTHPKDKLVSLREQEAVAALQLLGVEEEDVTFMRLPDGSLPLVHQPGFGTAVERIKQLVVLYNPQTILLPWQRDPHSDHRATWQIVNTALQTIKTKPRKLEYLIWLWERAAPEDLPKLDEVTVCSVDITAVMTQKKDAIAAHVSQTTRLINDDPDGFMLSPEVLAHFDRPFEIFVELN